MDYGVRVVATNVPVFGLRSMDAVVNVRGQEETLDMFLRGIYIRSHHPPPADHVPDDCRECVARIIGLGPDRWGSGRGRPGTQYRAPSPFELGDTISGHLLHLSFLASPFRTTKSYLSPLRNAWQAWAFNRLFSAQDLQPSNHFR